MPHTPGPWTIDQEELAAAIAAAAVWPPGINPDSWAIWDDGHEEQCDSFICDEFDERGLDRFAFV